jgi:hypothetical protein
MPSNPRDNLYGGRVPVERVEEVVADVLRQHFQPLTMDAVSASRELGREVVRRLGYYRLLAEDVEPTHCMPANGVHATPHAGADGHGCILR